MKTNKEKEERLSAYIDAMNEGRRWEPVADDDEELRDLMDTTLRLRSLKASEHQPLAFAEQVAARLRDAQEPNTAVGLPVPSSSGKPVRNGIRLALSALFLLVVTFVVLEFLGSR